MFLGGLAETTAQQVELKETSAKSFKLALKYIYSGKLDLDEFTDHNDNDNVDLLEIAHRYQLDTLATSLAKHMAGKIDAENALLYLVHAHAHGERCLEDACLAYIDENIRMVDLADSELVDEVRQVHH